MKALSIKQPWASLIAHGIKDIENRTWKTHFRGKIYIHASGQWDVRSKSNDARDLLTWEQNRAIPHQLHADFIDKGVIVKDDCIPLSSIIGEVEIIDCVINHESIWAEKTDFSQEDPQTIWNWVLANPVLYDKPIINVKGKLSFWEPEIDIVECIGCSGKFNYEEMKQDAGDNDYCSKCADELFPVLKKEYQEMVKNGEIEPE